MSVEKKIKTAREVFADLRERLDAVTNAQRQEREDKLALGVLPLLKRYTETAHEPFHGQRLLLFLNKEFEFLWKDPQASQEEYFSMKKDLLENIESVLRNELALEKLPSALQDSIKTIRDKLDQASWKDYDITI